MHSGLVGSNQPGGQPDHSGSAWGWQGQTEHPTSQLPPLIPGMSASTGPGDPTARQSPPDMTVHPIGHVGDEPGYGGANPKPVRIREFLRRNTAAVIAVVAGIIGTILLLGAALIGTVVAVQNAQRANTSSSGASSNQLTPSNPNGSDPLSPYGSQTDPNSQMPFGNSHPNQGQQDPYGLGGGSGSGGSGSEQQDPFGSLIPGMPSSPFGGNGSGGSGSGGSGGSVDPQDQLQRMLEQFQQALPPEIRNDPGWQQFFNGFGGGSSNSGSSEPNNSQSG